MLYPVVEAPLGGDKVAVGNCKQSLQGILLVGRVVLQTTGTAVLCTVDVPRPPHTRFHVKKHGGTLQLVYVVLAPRRLTKNAPDVHVLITDALNHHGTPTLAVMLLPGQRRGVLEPLPVGAENRTHAARHSTGRVAGQDALEFVLRRAAQVRRLSFVDNEVGKASGCLREGRRRKAAVLFGAAVRLPIAQHLQRRQQLLDAVRLQLIGRVNRASRP